MPIETHKLLVCTWEPAHTLDRVEAQQQAVANGRMKSLVKKHGSGPRLKSVLTKAGLVSVLKSVHGQLMCPECGAMMDTVLGRPGIADKVEALRDVVSDFDMAIQRTRESR